MALVTASVTLRFDSNGLNPQALKTLAQQATRARRVLTDVVWTDAQKPELVVVIKGGKAEDILALAVELKDNAERGPE